MSKYLEGAGSVRDNGRLEVDLPAGFAEKYPEVSAVFQGRLQDGGKLWDVPPASITLFVEGGRLKFVANPRGYGKVLFGCVRDALTGLAGVDQALGVGDTEWKKRK